MADLLTYRKFSFQKVNKKLLTQITVSLLILLLGINDVSAQNTLLASLKNKEDRGDELFKEFSYASAIDVYKKALNNEDAPKDAVVLKIAESYRMLNLPTEAAEWYYRVLAQNEQVASIYILHYAEALMSQEKYDEAKKWYQKYNDRVASDERGFKKVNSLEKHELLLLNKYHVDVNKASFNSDAGDFSPTLTKEGVVFVSSRASGKASGSIFNWDESNFLDLFIFNGQEVKNLSKNLNSKYHEGPAVLYHNDNKIIFTRNNYNRGKQGASKEGITKLKLYYAERLPEGDWSSPKEMPFNNNNYSVGHPAITSDGSMLYFSSDMPGGEGGVDLYSSQWKDGAWQDPVNLGPKINTKGNELFPTLYNDQELYFASNGHGGLGGLDIFVCDITNETRINNVGAPINGPLDDFGLVLLKDGISGYFSSNREEGGNKDNIYQFTSRRSLLMANIISGYVYDQEENHPISNALIVLTGNNSLDNKEVETDSLGHFSFEVEQNTSYNIQVQKSNYITSTKSLITADEGSSVWQVNMPLIKNDGFILTGKIIDNLNKEALSGVKISITDNITNTLVYKEESSDDGTFKYEIDGYKGSDTISYQIKLEREGYLTKVLSFDTFLGNVKIRYLNDVIDLSMLKLELGTDLSKIINIQPIFFDVGKYKIRPDAARELDKMVVLMKENPGIKIELGSHTDSRGSASSNLELSNKRAKASIEYIISKGISTERITGKGYGEQQLINQCVDNVPCSDQEHQVNRRTSFRITSF